MRPLRVVMIAASPWPAREGIGFYCHELAVHLGRLGIETTIITRGGARPLSHENGRVISLPFLPVYPFHVHLHGYIVNRFLSRRRGEFDVIHVHSPLPAVPDRGLAPIVTTVHTTIRHGAEAVRGRDLQSLLARLQSPISAQIEKRILDRSDLVVALSDEVRDAVSPLIGHSMPIRVLGNAVDTDTFSPAANPATEKVVLSAGRLVGHKGVDDLIRAWPRVTNEHPDAVLSIVGDGSYGPRLRTLASEICPGNSIVFHGGLDSTRRAELVRHYRTASVVAQPSRHEGLSTVLLEAMSCARTVVATPVGAHATVVENGVNGVLVPHSSPLVLAEKLNVLLSDAALRSRLGANARRTVEQRFSWSALAARYAECYDEARQRRLNAR